VRGRLSREPPEQQRVAGRRDEGLWADEKAREVAAKSARALAPAVGARSSPKVESGARRGPERSAHAASRAPATTAEHSARSARASQEAEAQGPDSSSAADGAAAPRRSKPGVWLPPAGLAPVRLVDAASPVARAARVAHAARRAGVGEMARRAGVGKVARRAEVGEVARRAGVAERARRAGAGPLGWAKLERRVPVSAVARVGRLWRRAWRHAEWRRDPNRP
jgi:hypothetical protein